MKQTTKALITIVGAITAILQLPVVQSFVQSYLGAHANIDAVIGGIIAILALIHNPKVNTTMAKTLIFALVIFGAASLKAQTTALPTNIYAAGSSYSVNASPAIAGTALYAHEVNTTGTYAFTVVDALPNTLRPFTVTTNIGVGVAQKIATFHNVPIYVPAAAGVSWSGSNTGWQWNGGALAAISFKKACSTCYLMPSVRFLKSSVSNGTGYQPIIGLLFGWGQ